MPIAIDRLVRSRRKTIALIVQPDGTLLVRAPLKIPEAHVRKFVEQHADWITKNQTRAQKYAPPPHKKYKDGETFLYLGQSYPLEIIPRQRSALTFDGATFHLAKSALLKAEEAFVRWYKRQAALVFLERAVFLARKHGFHYEKIRISSARTRWGSCSSKGTLSFTYRLAMAPPEVIDYVVIHELVHTKIKNHSKTFWARVSEIMPGYKLHVRWLRQNGKTL
ncbi:MAG: M48 family metallopeptidase, partial [Chloroflexi bacterium]|nr:M48 family metallopeptidase [Chloroflexota bacterium]